MRSFLATVLVAFIATGSAAACINDTELPQHEREFRSQYLHETYTSTFHNRATKNYSLAAFRVAGVGLLAVGFGATLLRRQNQE